jgi:threonine synthase
MLTGLARDGGLYVPETWPQLSHETIAGFFGRPYWEVAVEVIRPFVGGEISDADLGRMANEAYATFRHPAVVPLRQTGRINSCSSCFTARRWRSRTSRCS